MPSSTILSGTSEGIARWDQSLYSDTFLQEPLAYMAPRILDSVRTGASANARLRADLQSQMVQLQPANIHATCKAHLTATFKFTIAQSTVPGVRPSSMNTPNHLVAEQHSSNTVKLPHCGNRFFLKQASTQQVNLVQKN